MLDVQNLSEATRRTSAVLGDHGELLPKLKCPLQVKDQDLVGMDQTHNPHRENHQLSTDNNNNAADKICEYCNKGFRSGKALGGHVRIHFKNHPELMIFYKKLKSTQTIKFKKRKREEITLADIAKRINNSKRKPTGNGTGTGTAAVPTCSICSKTFPSMKSLFGHMRSHPNRDWRGIQPPPAVKSTASSASLVSDVEPQDTDDQASSAAAPVDLTESLLGWSATAKRGRKQAILDREILAAHELMRLAHGGGLFESSPTSKQRVFEEAEATNSNSFAYRPESEDEKKKKKRSFQELSDGYMKGVPHPVKQLSYPDDKKSEDTGNNKADNETGSLAGKSVNSQWEDTSNWPYDAGEDDESASRNTEQLNHKTTDGNGKVITVKNKKKRKKIKDLESVHDDSPVHQVVPATPDKYRCGTCDKSFPTHQALGGHRSSHNKIRITIHNSVEGSSQSAGDDEGLADSPVLEDEENKGSEEGAGSSKQVGDTHQYKICSRKFSTCQEAVGGHKNCQSVAVAPSSQVSSVGELSHTCGGGGRVLDFDLNEVPPVEDDAGFKSEHDVGGANCGHASSSFNSVEFPIFESSSSGL